MIHTSLMKHNAMPDAAHVLVVQFMIVQDVQIIHHLISMECAFVIPAGQATIVAQGVDMKDNVPLHV